MYKFVAVTDERVADGFRLGGTEVITVDSVESMHQELTQLFEDESIGIIAVDERYEKAIDERLQKKIDSVYRPVVVMLPLADRLNVAEYMSGRLQDMIRRAVGFDIKLKKEAGS
ncbi:MAG: hypothetical protein FWF45_04565 [Coriobacteriia bacterium]|nr:hypothetical protein [Coriobacteriia bacterium]